MRRVYRFAKTTIAVNLPFGILQNDRFSMYALDLETRADVEYYFEQVENDIEFSTEPVYVGKFAKAYYENGVWWREFCAPDECTRVYIKDCGSRGFCYFKPGAQRYLHDTKNVFNAIGIENPLIISDTIILHSSYICFEDRAILFTAPSGTGKSTQAQLWEKYKGARIINGDRSAIAREQGGYFAYGLPVAGSSHHFENITAPLKAIVILRRSDTNSVDALHSVEALKCILSETSINRSNCAQYQRALTLVCDVVQQVPIYVLRCRPDEGAVDALYAELYEKHSIGVMV